MNTFHHWLWNAQRHIRPLIARAPVPNNKHARFVCKELTNFINTQILKFSDFRDSIVPFSVTRTLNPD